MRCKLLGSKLCSADVQCQTQGFKWQRNWLPVDAFCSSACLFLSADYVSPSNDTHINGSLNLNDRNNELCCSGRAQPFLSNEINRLRVAQPIVYAAASRCSKSSGGGPCLIQLAARSLFALLVLCERQQCAGEGELIIGLHRNG